MVVMKVVIIRMEANAVNILLLMIVKLVDFLSWWQSVEVLERQCLPQYSHALTQTIFV